MYSGFAAFCCRADANAPLLTLIQTHSEMKALLFIMIRRHAAPRRAYLSLSITPLFGRARRISNNTTSLHFLARWGVARITNNTKSSRPLRAFHFASASRRVVKLKPRIPAGHSKKH